MPFAHSTSAAPPRDPPLAPVDLPTELPLDEALALFEQRLASNGAALMATTTDLDPPGPVVTFVNRAFTEQSGYAAEDIVGKTPRILQGPKTDRAMLARLKAALAAGEPFAAETVNYRRDGREYWVHWTIVPVRHRGRTVRYLSYQRVRPDAPERFDAVASRPLTIDVFDLVYVSESVAICVTDAAGLFVRVNAAYCRLLGYAEDELIGRHYNLILPPERVPLAEEAERQSRDGDQQVTSEWVLRRKDGQDIYTLATVGVLHRPDGQRYHVITLNDVTARTYREEQLRLSDTRLDLVVNQCGLGIWDWDMTTDEVYFSPGWKRMLGYQDHELPGGYRTWHDNVHPDDLAGALEVIAEYRDDRRPEFVIEFRMRHKDGSYRWIASRGAALRDATGRAYRLAGTHTDVTERRKAEDDARERAEMLRRVGDNLPGGGTYQFVREAGGRQYFTHLSAGIARVMGVPEADLMSGRARLFDLFHPDDRARATAGEERSAAELCVFEDKVSGRTPDGRERVWQFRSNPRRTPDGATVWDGVILDVTEQQQTAEQLRQVQKMEAVGHLAGGIAHDFNNLLTIILGRLDLVALPPGDANARHVETAVRAATRAAELTSQLLGFARRRPIRPAPADAAAILMDMADILHRTFDPRVKVRVRTSPDTPPALADAGALNQVLLNLCLNARDAMPDGGTLTLGAERVRVSPGGPGWCAEARPGEFVRLGVADTGTGIPDDVKARIFEPFFTTKPQGKGTGLGLAMVYGIMTQHAGWVTCSSTPGAGTRFDLYFPVSGKDASPPPPAPVPQPAPPVGKGGKSSVLVVDDEAGIRAFARAVLEREGYAVREAEDGPAAAEAVRAAPRPFGVILLDMLLAGESGAALLPELRRLSPASRVVVMSGMVMDAVPKGADGFLAKPFVMKDLLDVVQKALGDG